MIRTTSTASFLETSGRMNDFYDLVFANYTPKNFQVNTPTAKILKNFCSINIYTCLSHNINNNKNATFEYFRLSV